MKKYEAVHIGAVFGNLEVISEPERAKYTYYVQCICNCGKQKRISVYSLLRSLTTSCGCVQKLAASRSARALNPTRLLPNSAAILNRKYRAYDRGALERDLSFTLSKDVFRDLLSDVCYYCGAAGNPFVGIDRVDNSRGYEVDNCVSCCFVCNVLKLRLSKEEFLFQIKKIYEHLNLVRYTTSQDI